MKPPNGASTQFVLPKQQSETPVVPGHGLQWKDGPGQHVSNWVPNSQHVTPAGQQPPAHFVVPVGHSHSHVTVFGVCGGEHCKHWPLAHMTLRDGHPHVAVDGLQNWLQHSLLSRHLKPPFLQRPSAFAWPAAKRASTPPAPVANAEREHDEHPERQPDEHGRHPVEPPGCEESRVILHRATRRVGPR